MANEKSIKVYVQALQEQGFRRLGRWFGPTEVSLEVTEEELRSLLTAPDKLRVVTHKAKAELDELYAPAKAKVEAKVEGEPASPAAAKPEPAKTEPAKKS